MADYKGGIMAPMTFGAALKTAREARGLTLADLSARTKIRSEYLLALEQEQLAALPERTLVRSFLQSYAREVGLDAAPLLADLDTKLPTPAYPTGQPLAHPADTGVTRARPTLPLPTLLAGLLILGAAGYAWWSAQPAPAPAPTQPTTGATPTPPASVVTTPKTVHLTVNSTPSGARVLLDNRALGLTPLASFPVEGRQGVVLRVEYGDLRPFKQKIDLRQSRNLRVQLSGGMGSSPSQMTDVVTGKTQDSLPVAAPKTTSATVGSTQKGVTLSFDDASWVRVSSGQGAVLYEGILPAGTQRNYPSGIRVRVGNAGAVRVSVDGSAPERMGAAGEAITRNY